MTERTVQKRQKRPRPEPPQSMVDMKRLDENPVHHYRLIKALTADRA
jgi:hypothetical protein